MYRNDNNLFRIDQHNLGLYAITNISDANSATNKRFDKPGRVIIFDIVDAIGLGIRFNFPNQPLIAVNRLEKIILPFSRFYLTYTQAASVRIYTSLYENFDIALRRRRLNFSIQLTAGNEYQLATLYPDIYIEQCIVESFGNIVYEDRAGTRTLNNVPAGTIIEKFDAQIIYNSTTSDLMLRCSQLG